MSGILLSGVLAMVGGLWILWSSIGREHSRIELLSTVLTALGLIVIGGYGLGQPGLPGGFLFGGVALLGAGVLCSVGYAAKQGIRWLQRR